MWDYPTFIKYKLMQKKVVKAMQCLNIGFDNMDSSFVMTTHKKCKISLIMVDSFIFYNFINSCFKWLTCDKACVVCLLMISVYIFVYIFFI